MARYCIGMIERSELTEREREEFTSSELDHLPYRFWYRECNEKVTHHNINVLFCDSCLEARVPLIFIMQEILSERETTVFRATGGAYNGRGRKKVNSSLSGQRFKKTGILE